MCLLNLYPFLLFCLIVINKFYLYKIFIYRFILSLANIGCVLKKIISGAMKRHQQTMDYCLKTMQLSTTEKITNNDWNEFDHRDIIAKYEPRYADLNELKKDIFLDKSPKEKITEVLVGAVTRWTSGQFNDYNESWTTFCERVINGLQKIENESQKEDVVLFSVPVAVFPL
jgi:broad specificity phosphatase PhoE